MREGGKILSDILKELRLSIKPGITTVELAQIVEAEVEKNGVRAGTLGYQGFPDSLCISINDVVVHGIPSQNKEVKEGDIVGCDFVVEHKGLLTDAAFSMIAGQPKSQADRILVETTKKSLQKGISKVKNGTKIGTISNAVQKVLEAQGLAVIRDFGGHGIGDEMHEDPHILNYGKRDTGFVLKTGMTICIEPMASLGSNSTYIENDGWTARTRDGSRSAHFEHTVLVTDTGYEILT